MEKIKMPDGYVPVEMYMCKPLSKRLMERMGLLKYAAQKGTSTILIKYDADVCIGKIIVLRPLPDEKLMSETNQTDREDIQ